MTGTVTRVVEDRGFCFIKPDDGSRDVFGHISELKGLPFDSTLQERRVEFGVAQSDKGPRATNVRPA